MNCKTTIIALGSLLLTLGANAADTIAWESAKASITPQGDLTVEVTVNVNVDSPQGDVRLYLQQTEKIHDAMTNRINNTVIFSAARYTTKPLGNNLEANVAVEKGKRTLTLKRTIPLPKDLAEVEVWTPLYLPPAPSTQITKRGVVKIDWHDKAAPSASIEMPK